MALAAALAANGAWAPTWKVSREVKGTGKRVKVTEPCMAGFVFVPEWGTDLPHVPRIPYGMMRQPNFTLTRVPDRQLNALRDIADKPLIPAHKLPSAGEWVKVIGGPYEGFHAKVLHCSQRYAVVTIKDAGPFGEKLQIPPSLLKETSVNPEPAKRGIRHRNRA